MIDELQNAAHSWFGVSASIVGALLLGLLLQWFASTLLARVTREDTLLGSVSRRVRRPMHVLVPLLALHFALMQARDDVPLIDSARHLSALGVIIAFTWAALRIVAAVAEVLVRRHPVTGVNNYEARRIQTQSRVLGRTLSFVVGVVGFSIALMTFPTVRNVGTSLLASAGIAGLAVGLAAKSVLGNLMAGVQLALTQPLRLDDVLVINGEFGNVEEITGTYVVMHLWDERRQIVPLQWFIENPFENWTRTSANLLGSVLLWVDYSMPIEPLRNEAQRLVRQAPEWDKRACGVQVTDSSETAVQVRVLVSACDSSRLFDLRCKLREGLLAFIQQSHPASLPLRRTELHAPGNGSSPPQSANAPRLTSSSARG